MKIITSKTEINLLIEKFNSGDKKSPSAITAEIEHLFLNKKIKFPLLEYVSKKLHIILPQEIQLKVCDKIIDLHTIGGNVITGIILQLRLKTHFKESHAKAIEYIITGNQWYVCDIIGERVMGYSLLTQPEKTIPLLKKNAKHPDKWIVRSVGVATHYAVKKGLKREYALQMFELLLTCSNTTDFHTKKGIGWAAKTIAKFHPDIIGIHKNEIETNPEIKQWFKTKIKIGLGRSFKYAHRYKG